MDGDLAGAIGAGGDVRVQLHRVALHHRGALHNLHPAARSQLLGLCYNERPNLA